MITINYAVKNGGKYIRYFLDSLKTQTYKNFRVNIWDNDSDDDTKEIVRSAYPEFNLIENPENIGFWAAMERMINEDKDSKYIICMTDVILKDDFLENVAAVMDNDPDCGALQAKVYRMELYGRQNKEPRKTNIIDTLGFKLFRSRKLINLGHGEEDKGQYDSLREIFGVEGAVPVFRREALESCRINGFIIDPDYRVGPFGYGDDFDLAWRLRLFGWKHVLSNRVIAYHDRSTTKGYSRGLKDYFKRLKERRKIDIQKKRLDWRNTRFTIVKNDYIINVYKDLPWIIAREIAVLGYTLLFEPGVLAEAGNFIKYLPKMIRKRKEIMAKAKTGPRDMRKWITR